MEPNVQLAAKNKTRVKTGETISELAHRHLRDRSHVTTDEELRNVKVDPGSYTYDELPEDDYAEIGKEETAKNVPPTPWDVIT